MSWNIDEEPCPGPTERKEGLFWDDPDADPLADLQDALEMMKKEVPPYGR